MFETLFGVIAKAVKAISPGGVVGYETSEEIDASDLFNMVKTTLDPSKAVHNMNLEVEAAKSVAYYPMVFGNTVSAETANTLAKLNERRVAEMIRLVVSRNDFIDLKKVNSKDDVIKQFRGVVFGPATADTSIGNAHQAISVIKTESVLAGIRSVTPVEVTMYLKENYGKVLAKAMLPVEETSMESLNESHYFGSLLEAPSFSSSKEKKSYNAGLRTARDSAVKYMNQQESKFNSEKAKLTEKIKKIEAKPDARMLSTDTKKIYKLNSFEPTIMEVDVIYGADGAMKSTTIILAIKSSVHAVDSNDLVKEISNAIYTERPGFRLIQWYAGEISFGRDLLLAVDKVKPYFTSDRSPAAAMFAQLLQNAKNAQRINMNGKSATAYIPTATMVLTIDEIEAIKRQCQEDVREPTSAMKLMNVLGLLNLYIVEESTGALYRFDHSIKAFDKTSIPQEENENRKTDNLVKALSMALVKR